MVSLSSIQWSSSCTEILHRCAQYVPIKSWISQVGSMTRALHQLPDARVELNLLNIDDDQRCSPLFGDNNIKSLGLGSIREMQWVCNSQVWMYGVSFIPNVILQKLNGLLSSQQSNPLGDILFSDNIFTPRDFEFAVIDSSDPFYQRVTKDKADHKPDESLIARRRSFDLDRYSIIIIEVFFSDFLKI